MKLCCNLGMLFTEVPFLDRFERARAAGFDAVEFPWPAEVRADDVVAASAGMDVVLMNFFAGDLAAGDRGVAADPDRLGEFRANVPPAIDLARRIGCGKLNVLLGRRSTAIGRGAQLMLAVASLRYAADAAAEIGAQVLVEPLNPIDNGPVLIQRTAEALALLDRVGRPNVGLQYDVFHAQRTEGNLVETIRRSIDRIAHVQIADCPGRGEPGTGEIDFGYVLAELERAGYAGYVGLEYVPTTPTTERSLGWTLALEA